MLFLKLKNGKPQNMLFINQIFQDKNKIVFVPAKGSLNNIEEIYDNENDAKSRFEQLKIACMQ